jgi:hypothetical protein
MQTEGIDALVVCGNQYTGFEGAVRYLSGFEIVHRYVYVLLPLEADPTLVFPREARWIGDKSKPWMRSRLAGNSRRLAAPARRRERLETAGSVRS